MPTQGQIWPRVGGDAAAGGGGGGIPSGVPHWIPGRGYGVGDLVRWGGGLYQAKVIVAAGVTTPPSAYHDFAVSRRAPVSEYFNAAKRYYFGAANGNFNNDIDNKPARVVRVDVAAGGVSFTFTPSIAMTAYFYVAPSDTFPGAGNSVAVAAGSSGSFNTASLYATAQSYYILMVPTTAGQTGYVDVTASDYTKLTSIIAWEPITAGGPPMSAWLTTAQLIGAATTADVNFDAAAYDLAGSYSAPNWTCPTGGWWRIGAYGMLLAVGGTARADLFLVNTGGGGLYRQAYTRHIARQFSPSGAGDLTLEGSVLVACTRGSRWRITVANTDSAPRSLNGAGSGAGSTDPDTVAARFEVAYVGPLH